MSSFKEIRPRSTNPGEAADDASRPNSLPSESSIAIGKGRKRKAPVHVSQNACTNCKRARAKCDGVEGQTCTRCISRSMSATCTYELHVKTAKEELVRKIKNLEGLVEQLQSEIKEKDAWIQAMAVLFSPGTQGARLLEQLSLHDDSYNALQSALNSAPAITRRSSGGSQALRGSDSDEAMETDEEAPSRWTSVTQDDSKIHHLLALYFAWVHPAHMFFSERHFMDSFRRNDRVYCSSALVNALCALGCRYYVEEVGNEAAIKKLGERFTQQVWAEMKSERRLTPLSAVTYAVIFLNQLSAGQARDAFVHLRLAFDSLRQVDHSNWSDEAFEITYFGIHSLNINWAALTYQKPPAALSHTVEPFKGVDLDLPESFWRDYKLPKDAGNRDVSSRALECAKESARLSLIILDTLIAWCGSTRKITTKDILQLYDRFLAWKRDLPSSLDAPTSPVEDVHGGDLLPYVLLLHINYCVALSQLFNPLLECETLSKYSKTHVQSVIVHNAQEGLILFERYSNLFDSRYQSPMQLYCLVHLADIVLRQDRANADRIVHFTLKTLGQTLPGFPVAGPLQAMFCESVVSCGLSLPKDVTLLMGGRSWQSYSREDKLGSSERLTYAQPVDLLVAAIHPSLPADFKKEWDKLIENHGQHDTSSSSPRRMSSVSLPASSKIGTETRVEPRGMDISSLVNP